MSEVPPRPPRRKRSLTEEERLALINRALTHFNAGLEHRRAGRLADAELEFTAAIALEAPHVHINKDFYQQRAQVREAQADYRRALDDHTLALAALDQVTYSTPYGWGLHRLEVACLRLARGRLRLHHLGDRDGGLEDLQWAAELGLGDAAKELEQARRA